MNSKCSGEPAHLHSRARTFTVRINKFKLSGNVFITNLSKKFRVANMVLFIPVEPYQDVGTYRACVNCLLSI